MRKILLKNRKIVKCFRCKKKIEARESKFNYNAFFCRLCYKKFNKHAGKEVDKILGYL